MKFNYLFIWMHGIRDNILLLSCVRRIAILFLLESLVFDLKFKSGPCSHCAKLYLFC